MPTEELKGKVLKLADDLHSCGFERFDSYTIKRERTNIEQFIQLQPGHRSLEGKFTINLAWRFTMDGVPAEGAIHHSLRIGSVLGEGDVWFPHHPEDALEDSYFRVMETI